jgi:hypothetical protein
MNFAAAPIASSGRKHRMRNFRMSKLLPEPRAAKLLHTAKLMAVLVDDDPASSNNVSGLIGLQIEGAPCIVSFRNLWLKKIDWAQALTFVL